MIEDYPSDKQSEEQISSYENSKRSSAAKRKAISVKRPEPVKKKEKYTKLEEEKNQVKNPKIKDIFEKNSIFELIKQKEEAIFALQKRE